MSLLLTRLRSMYIPVLSLCIYVFMVVVVVCVCVRMDIYWAVFLYIVCYLLMHIVWLAGLAYSYINGHLVFHVLVNQWACVLCATWLHTWSRSACIYMCIYICSQCSSSDENVRFHLSLSCSHVLVIYRFHSCFHECIWSNCMTCLCSNCLHRQYKL